MKTEQEALIELPDALVDVLLTLWVRDHGNRIWGDPEAQLRAYEGPDVPRVKLDSAWLNQVDAYRVEHVKAWRAKGDVEVVILTDADGDVQGVRVEFSDGAGFSSYLNP